MMLFGHVEFRAIVEVGGHVEANQIECKGMEHDLFRENGNQLASLREEVQVRTEAL